MEQNQIRNIALLDHEGAGETTLLESMLHQAGLTQRMGHIAEHNTISDFDPDEKALEKSLYCATISFPYRGLLLNCLDVPGSQDAISDAMTAMHAVEAALICIDAVDGIKINTRRVWNLAARRGLPRLIVMTKLDSEHADFAATLAAIRDEFGSRCLPLYLPDSSGSGISGVSAILSDRNSDACEQLIETVVETDDALMERYLEGEPISDEEISLALKSALLHGDIFPVIPTAADREIGVKELLDTIAAIAPAPGEVAQQIYQNHEPVSAANIKGFSGFVYHTDSDEFAGRIAYMRIISGTLSAHSSLINRRTGETVKATHILRISGKQQDNIDSAGAGDLIAIPRVDDVHAGDLITDSATEISMDEIRFPRPMVSLAVRPRTNRDGQKLGTALHEFANDDRTFHVHADSQTHDLIISGMSDLHLQRILNRLQRRYKVDIDTSTPQVPYMETITGRVQGVEYTHKKQSGGAGQFGRVVIDLEPLPRGEGYQFIDNIHGGVIDTVFRPSVDKGVQAAMAEGVLAGFPVTDVRVTLVDGKTHSVDSKDIAFQIAGQKAFKQAFEQCRPVLLEPIVKMEITIPQNHIGDVLGDLNGHRGQVLATDIKGNSAIVQALAPMAEIQSYQAQLKAMTGGEGSYTIEFDHYDIVPAAIQKRILAERQNQA